MKKKKCSLDEDGLATIPKAFRLVDVIKAEQVVVISDEVHCYVVCIVVLDKLQSVANRQFNVPSSKYRGFVYRLRPTIANLIFSSNLPLIPVLLLNLSLVSLKSSPGFKTNLNGIP